MVALLSIEILIYYVLVFMNRILVTEDEESLQIYIDKIKLINCNYPPKNPHVCRLIYKKNCIELLRRLSGSPFKVPG